MTALLQSVGPLPDQGPLQTASMRFSIQSLLVLVLLSALVASLLRTLHAQYQAAQVEASLKGSFTSQFRDNSPTGLNDIEWSLDHTEQGLQNRMAQQATLLSTLTDAFYQDAARFKITPVANKLSVLELPTIQQPNHDVNQHWQIHVPGKVALSITVEFIDQSGQIQTTPDGFFDQTPVTAKLGPGLNKVAAVLLRASESEQGQMTVHLNGDLLLDRVHKPQKRSGMTSYVINYQKQHDFEIKPSSLPRLLQFHPNPGDTGIRIRIISRLFRPDQQDAAELRGDG